MTALSLLIGDRALVVGQEDGALSVWFQVRQGDETLPADPGAGVPRPHRRDHGDRAVAAQQGVPGARRDGDLGLYYSTSQRTLWTGASPIAHAIDASCSRRRPTALFLAGGGRLAALRCPQPASRGVLAGAVRPRLVRGVRRPEYAWQSTGGTDDFEPKLSLTPLLVGTLKGTVYSLILAIPLGVLGAMYASQFMHPKLLRFVKPTVEIMAALPSVVLGFLAGLWLAPHIERSFPGLVLMAVVLPALRAGGGRRLARAAAASCADGSRRASRSSSTPRSLALGIWGCLQLAPAFAPRRLRRQLPGLAAADLPDCPTTSATRWWWVWRWASR